MTSLSISAAPEEALAMMHVVPSPRPSVTDLLAAERQAFVRFEAACLATDSVRLGREPTAAEETEYEAASTAQKVAFDLFLSEPPRSNGDLIALLNHFDERRGDILAEPFASEISNLFASARAFLDPDGYGAGGEPHPVDVLWAEWHALIVAHDADGSMTEEEADRSYDNFCDIAKRIEAAEPGAMQAAAIALIEIYFENADPDEQGFTPRNLLKRANNDVGRLAMSTVASLRPLLSGSIGRIAADLLDNPGGEIGFSALWRGQRQLPALPLAAE